MALKRSQRFVPVHKLAKQSENMAAQTLGKVQRELEAQHARLNELMMYHEDYVQRFTEAASKGMNITQALSYQKFISQLETAIGEQKKQIERMREACDARKADWNSERKKTQVLEKVMLRYRKQEQQQEQRQEQRRNDEFVANQYWHKVKNTP